MPRVDRQASQQVLSMPAPATSAPLSSGNRHPLRVLLSLVSDEKGRVVRAVASAVIN